MLSPEESLESCGPAIDLDALKSERPEDFALLEAVCLCALDARNSILCLLSAESSEWSGGKIIRKRAREYVLLMKRANRNADVFFDNPEWVVFAMMSRLAKKTGAAMLLPWTK
jgi:hypothetical protein